MMALPANASNIKLVTFGLAMGICFFKDCIAYSNCLGSAMKGARQLSNYEWKMANKVAPLAASMAGVTKTMPGIVGDADLSFYRGIELEKNGQARAAFAAFHEAATLYQCFLDQEEDNAKFNQFDHVTGLSATHNGKDGGCRPVLAYACIRLAHLSNDALGDPNAATRLYKEAASIDPSPSSVSYDGIGTSIESSRGDLSQAIAAYHEARRLAPNNGNVAFHLAVALEREGLAKDADIVFENLRDGDQSNSCLVDSWGYVRWHTRRVKPRNLNLHRGTHAMFQMALNAAMDMIRDVDGIVCEFGVGSGRSMRMIQEMLPLNVPIYGFDTFTGLPQAWGGEPVGTYSTGGVVPQMEGDVTFFKGLFKDTIPAFLATTEIHRPIAFVNVDCDLYRSTLDILEGLQSRVVPGTIILFDEYLCHPTWRQVYVAQTNFELGENVANVLGGVTSTWDSV